MGKDFHILTDLFSRYLGVNLGRFDIGVSHHSADGFNRNSL